jgi:DNA polymerase III epsilon subunit-like protein
MFCDLETTGLDYNRNEIISMAVIMTNHQLDRLSDFDLLIRPEKIDWWDEGAEKFHGYSLDVCKDFPSKDKALKDFFLYLDSFGQQELSFVCHAKAMYGKDDYFDYQFVRAFISDDKLFYKYFPTNKFMSTIVKKGSSRWNIPNQKLPSWANKLGIELTHHNARSDVEACYEIFKHQRQFPYGDFFC